MSSVSNISHTTTSKKAVPYRPTEHSLPQTTPARGGPVPENHRRSLEQESYLPHQRSRQGYLSASLQHYPDLASHPSFSMTRDLQRHSSSLSKYLVHPKQVALPFCSSLLPAAWPERNYPSDWSKRPVDEKEAFDLIQPRDNLNVDVSRSEHS